MSTTRLARGIRVGDRYRLERELGHGTDGTTWEAVDERLDRPVALRLFAPGADRKTIVRRAGLAASLTHPRVVRVFDTGEDEGRFFTVSEFVSESLQTVRLPLAPDVALQTAIDIAEALQYAHERSVVHGNIHEGNVLLSEGGAKVGDFALSPNSAHANVSDDLQQFGAMMRRVCRASAGGTPPSALLRIVERLTTGAFASAADVLGELRTLRPAPVRAERPPPRRGWLVILIALLLGLVAFGAMRLGGRSEEAKLLPDGRVDGTPLRTSNVVSFDPFTTDAVKVENEDDARSAIDGNETTAWTTERYSGSADFNGKKAGVGLIITLQDAGDVGKARVLWVAQGCNFQLRYSDDPAAPIGEWGTAATIPKSKVASAFEFESVAARYWMVWITQLVPDSGGDFRCGIREAQLFSP